MGQTAFVKSPSRPLTVEKTTRSFRLHLDVPLALFTLSLLVIGLMMVYSASWLSAKGNDTYFVLRQAIFVIAGSGLAIALSLFDYHRYQRLLIPMILTALALLVAVLFFGETRQESTRTLFGGSVQPSEFAMLALVIYLSFWLYSKREVLNRVTFGLLPMMFMLGIFGALIWKQPDFSAAITILMIGGLMFFLANAEWRQVILVLVAAVIIGYLIISFTSTGQDRWTKWQSGMSNPNAASDHMKRVFEAINRGGLFGVGIGNSTTKFTGLPLPWTDSIYAVIVEETGLVGGTVVIVLYLLFLWRGLQISSRAPDQLGRMLAGGLTFWICFDALLNMGVMVNLFPFAGNALPLISYGGSSMISTLAGIGIIMNVARSSARRDSAAIEGRSYSAVVDMRRRDRRGGVSRPGSPQGPGR